MANTAEKKTFNVGVIGYGLSATVFHIPFIRTTPGLNLHSILQRNPSASSSAPRDHPALHHHTTLEPFLADPALDVVVITTPPPTHLPLATAALEAGKHVLVEKPFVATSSAAASLASLARARGLRLCVYQNRRFDADFATVAALVRSGRLGERVLEFETHFDRYRASRPGGWKGGLPLAEGGSALYDLGSHLVDQVYALFGMPRGVFAKLVSQRDGAALFDDDASAADGTTLEPDGVTMQLAYPGGMLALVRISVLSAEARQPRFWVRGTAGSYRKAGLDVQEPQLRAGMAPDDPQFGREDPAAWAGTLTTVSPDDGSIIEQTWPNIDPPPTYGRLYELFAKALAGDEPDVPVPAEQACDVLRILEAAIESARTKREVQLS
ncbi:hypothetical protein F5X96DRAFT_622513 [Biscogniauxia mediterranea]|nr:hypothetical protein F5X96DRAFT_622513 [Biscogniauxia mediterranea]